MAFPASTNVDGSNPGPNSASLPDTVQMPTGNIWKLGVFSLALTPVAVAANTTAEQAFAATGIGLVVGDFVALNKPSFQAGLAIGNVRVSAVDTLAITYVNDTAAPIVPTAETYVIKVDRKQPNWSAPASGNQLDW
jgi:hypothetical protein